MSSCALPYLTPSFSTSSFCMRLNLPDCDACAPQHDTTTDEGVDYRSLAYNLPACDHRSLMEIPCSDAVCPPCEPTGAGARAVKPGRPPVSGRAAQSQRPGNSRAGAVKRYNISFVNKSQLDGAKVSDRIPDGAEVLAIEDRVSARVGVSVGTTYYFDISGSKRNTEVYFTTDSVGGPSDTYGGELPGTKSTSSGTLALKVDSRTPSRFYLQSRDVEYAGVEFYVKK